MKLRLVSLSFIVVLAAYGPALAHDTDSQNGPLGKVSFPTSCDPKVQPAFERAVAMLHSFWYSAGEQAFRDVLKADPQCAIATWGIASILMSNPLAGQGASPKGAEQAQAAIDEGRRIGAKTERERGYIEAVAAYYQDFATRPEKERQASRAKAYEALAQRYPTDDEAQIFYALYLAGTQTQADQTYAAYLKAAAILEDEFRKYPDHPGVAHYLIHSYDAPPIADKGLIAARRYATIAPDAPHALHMPSHIFTRVGSWQESAATNMRSREVAKAGNEPDEAYHASDYMVYAVPAARPRRRRASSHRRSDENKRRQRAFRRAVRHGRDAGALCLRARRLGRRRRSCSRRAPPIPLSSRSRISHAAWARRAAAIWPRLARMPSSSKPSTRRCSMRRTPIGRPRSRSSGWLRPPGSRWAKASPTRRSSSCARPPTSRTATRSISSRQVASSPRARCWAKCCSK